MNISWLDQSERLAALSALYTSTQTQNSGATETQTRDTSLNWLGGASDSVSLSAEGLALSRIPPPEKPDFANMADEELTNFLETMQQNTGGYIPGVESGTEVSDLTSEQLAGIREQLASMPERGVGGMQGVGMPMGSPPSQGLQEMSDEDLVSLLQQIQDSTGSVPGVEDSETTDINELTEEQLQEARDALSEFLEMLEEASRKRANNSANQASAPSWMNALQGTAGMQGMGGMQGPPPPPPIDAVNSMSDEDLTSLLTAIQEETGSIPGIEDSESTDAATLTEEQLETARDALSDMMRQRMEEMMQTMRMSQAISAYSANSTASL